MNKEVLGKYIKPRVQMGSIQKGEWLTMDFKDISTKVNDSYLVIGIKLFAICMKEMFQYVKFPAFTKQ